MNTQSTLSFLDPALLRPSLVQAFAKLDPRVQWRNPVMFVVYAGSILTSVLWLLSLGSAALPHARPGAGRMGRAMPVLQTAGAPPS